MKNFIIIILAFLLVSTLNAQNGTLTGTVIEAESGMTTIGANVLVVGTSQGTSTDLDGKYLIKGIEPGVYTVECSYLGFETKKIENVRIEAGEVTTLDVKLGEATVDIGLEVVVEAKKVTNTESALLAVQRKSAVALDGISASQISKAGDKDVAGAIRRIPGVTVQGGKYVYVRGLGDRYSKTTLNGAEIPGLDPNRNTVQMDLFPTPLIDNIMVAKTFAPNFYGDFSGGYIDITTKDFPEAFTLNISASVGVNTASTFNKNIYTSKRGKLDLLGFDDGSRGLPTLLQDNKVPNTTTSSSLLPDMTRAFSNNWTMEQVAKPVNHNLSFSVGDQVSLFGKPLGLVFSLTYQHKFSGFDDGNYGIYGLTENVANNPNTSLNRELVLKQNASSDNILWGGMFGSSYKIANGHKIGLTLMHNQSGTTSTRYLSGRKYRDDKDDVFETRTWKYTQRSLSTMQLRGKHVFAKAKNLEINWQSSYSLSLQKTPDLRYFTNRYRTETGEDTKYFIKPSSDRMPSRFYRDMEQGNWSNKVDLALPFKQWSDLSAKVRAGASYLMKNRNFKEKRYQFNQKGIRYNGDPTAYFQESNLIAYDAESGNYANGGDGIFVSNSEGDDLRNTYDAAQNVIGAYAMVEMPIIRKLRFVGGLRMETTDIRLKSYSQQLLTKYPEVDGEQKILNNVDFLPSVNLNYEFTEKMKLRMGYNRTLARPTFRELAPFSSFDVEGGYLFTGNPDLDRTLIDNVDLRWEWYFNPGEIVSVSGFYKNFTNPIERTFNPEQPNGEFTYRNVDNALLAGVELEVRKKLNFAPVLEDFTVALNFSYIYSRTTIDAKELEQIHATNPDVKPYRALFGQSPYSVNAALYYQNKFGTNCNLVFNIVGPRIAYITSGGTPNIYEQSRPQLDFNVSQRIVKGLTATFSAKNLLNTSYNESIEFNGRTYNVNSYDLGMSFSLGVKYNLTKAE
ncbi:MAG: TonB-dependent receptor [Aureispira sp.]|nr:TonB-dependent receptor [Aureispira sp.]